MYKSRTTEKSIKYKKQTNTTFPKGNDPATKRCLLHGNGFTRTTDQCKTLAAQEKRMKQTYDTLAPIKKKTYKQKQELNALVEAAVQHVLAEKKTKSKQKDATEHELNKLEHLSLSSYSTSDFEKKKIDS